MKYTYEIQENTNKLETYEWDDIWWEHAPENTANRALIIGDSVSCGYRRKITEELRGEIYIDGLGTSKALDNEFYPELIDYVIRQQRYGSIIQFNNGLHGWHLSSQEYRYYYTKMIDYMMGKYNSKKLIVALTTPVREKKALEIYSPRNDLVLERNRIASEIAAEKNLIINDLYSPISDRPELWQPDGVHLTEEGYTVLAKQTAKLIKSQMSKSAEMGN